MGICFSTVSQHEHQQQTNNEIGATHQWLKFPICCPYCSQHSKPRQEFQLVILGPGYTGKTTLRHHLVQRYGHAFCKADFLMYRDILQHNVLDLFRDLLQESSLTFFELKQLVDLIQKQQRTQKQNNNKKTNTIIQNIRNSQLKLLHPQPIYKPEIIEEETPEDMQSLSLSSSDEQEQEQDQEEKRDKPMPLLSKVKSDSVSDGLPNTMMMLVRSSSIRSEYSQSSPRDTPVEDEVQLNGVYYDRTNDVMVGFDSPVNVTNNEKSAVTPYSSPCMKPKLKAYKFQRLSSLSMSVIDEQSGFDDSHMRNDTSSASMILNLAGTNGGTSGNTTPVQLTPVHVQQLTPYSAIPRISSSVSNSTSTPSPTKVTPTTTSNLSVAESMMNTTTSYQCLNDITVTPSTISKTKSSSNSNSNSNSHSNSNSNVTITTDREETKLSQPPAHEHITENEKNVKVKVNVNDNVNAFDKINSWLASKLNTKPKMNSKTKEIQIEIKSDETKNDSKTKDKKNIHSVWKAFAKKSKKDEIQPAFVSLASSTSARSDSTSNDAPELKHSDSVVIHASDSESEQVYKFEEMIREQPEQKEEKEEKKEDTSSKRTKKKTRTPSMYDSCACGCCELGTRTGRRLREEHIRGDGHYLDELLMRLSVEDLKYGRDNGQYLISNCCRILDDDFEPTFKDLLQCHVRSTGLMFENHVMCRQLPVSNTEKQDITFRVVDVGGHRNERKKWTYVLEQDNDAIVFVVSAASFCQVLFEDFRRNAMRESLQVWKEIIYQCSTSSDLFLDHSQESSFRGYYHTNCNNKQSPAHSFIRKTKHTAKPKQNQNREEDYQYNSYYGKYRRNYLNGIHYYCRAQFILVINKIDLFYERYHLFKDYFPEYTGETTPNSILDYIKNMYLDVAQEKGVHIHCVTAQLTDELEIATVDIDAIREVLMTIQFPIKVGHDMVKTNSAESYYENSNSMATAAAPAGCGHFGFYNEQSLQELQNQTHTHSRNSTLVDNRINRFDYESMYGVIIDCDQKETKQEDTRPRDNESHCCHKKYQFPYQTNMNTNTNTNSETFSDSIPGPFSSLETTGDSQLDDSGASLRSRGASENDVIGYEQILIPREIADIILSYSVGDVFWSKSWLKPMWERKQRQKMHEQMISRQNEQHRMYEQRRKNTLTNIYNRAMNANYKQEMTNLNRQVHYYEARSFEREQQLLAESKRKKETESKTEIEAGEEPVSVFELQTETKTETEIGIEAGQENKYEEEVDGNVGSENKYDNENGNGNEINFREDENKYQEENDEFNFSQLKYHTYLHRQYRDRHSHRRKQLSHLFSKRAYKDSSAHSSKNGNDENISKPKPKPKSKPKPKLNWQQNIRSLWNKRL